MSAPAVAVSRDGKKFAAAWMDKRNGKRRVYWTVADQPKFASDAPIHVIDDGQQDHPALTIDRIGTTWAVWTQNNAGRSQIWFRDSDDNKQPKQLSSESDGKTSYASIASNNSVVAVVYESAVNGQHRLVCRAFTR